MGNVRLRLIICVQINFDCFSSLVRKQTHESPQKSGVIKMCLASHLDRDLLGSDKLWIIKADCLSHRANLYSVWTTEKEKSIDIKRPFFNRSHLVSPRTQARVRGTFKVIGNWG